ncbi:MAG TPA: glycine-rich protein, partial [Acidimicrobiia bacterium]
MQIRTRILRPTVLAAVVAALGLTACVPFKTAPPPPQVATPPAQGGPLLHVETFEYTGAPQLWVVPDGVTEAVVTVQGARGGGTIAWPTHGGLGARATALMPVTPGENVYVYVGSAGQHDASEWCSSPLGGYNGGGPGGKAQGFSGGGGGGGASDIRVGGFTLDHRALVAGGGGAGFGNDGYGSGGWAGDPNATAGNGGTTPLVEGGDGATQAAWGGFGWGNPSPSADGDRGDFGEGGAGGGDLTLCPDPDGVFYAGGGGGGGYWGGGGAGFGNDGYGSGGWAGVPTAPAGNGGTPPLVEGGDGATQGAW